MQIRLGVSRGRRSTVPLAFAILLTGVLLSPVSTARAEAGTPAGVPTGVDTSEVLLDFSLEQLMNIKVTSASKKAQRLEEIPAAVYVLTAEDLQRSGASTLPDALRLVPGMSVARLDTNKWAVSCRGFTGRFANKMLVLIDGRSVYTEIFSGVLWEALEMPLAEVERIEVIRGPGASMWGANAVNGVVNIITKHTRETRGAWSEAGVGDHAGNVTALRYGGTLGRGGSYRIGARYLSQDAYPSPSEHESADQFEIGRLGFRVDWAGSAGNEWLFTGDLYDAEAAGRVVVPTLAPPYGVASEGTDPFVGRSFLARWTGKAGPRELSIQANWQRNERSATDVLTVEDESLDLDLVARRRFARGLELMSGVGYRLYRDDPTYEGTVFFDPVHPVTHLLSSFAQGGWDSPSGRWSLLLGSKFETKTALGWEIQPNARLLFRPRPGQAAWLACARAARTPSRVEESGTFNVIALPPNSFFPQQIPILMQIEGRESMRAEHLTALEAGYRVGISTRAHLDLAVFDNHYTDLGAAVGQPLVVRQGASGDYYVLPYAYTNGDEAESWGAELATDVYLSPHWRLRGAYSYFRLDLDPEDDAPRLPVFIDPGRESRHHLFGVLQGSPHPRV
ncbi:MAG: TonB-dependent receptor [Candidatus Eisenbacteria bacterium]|nr:TonB-dependent receptor [Candidatus Eisenbacteria bacterium]